MIGRLEIATNIFNNKFLEIYHFTQQNSDRRNSSRPPSTSRTPPPHNHNSTSPYPPVPQQQLHSKLTDRSDGSAYIVNGDSHAPGRTIRKDSHAASQPPEYSAGIFQASPVTTSSSYPASPQFSPSTVYPYSPATLSTTMSPATPTTYPRHFPLDDSQEDRKASFESFNSSNHYPHSASSPQHRNLGPLPLPIPQVHNRGLTDLERYQSGTPES
jgi:hypothetical protein